ncbi:MAG: M48 family metalloprotease [Alcaligenaceae bacterium]
MNSLQSMPKKCMVGLLVLSLGWQSAWAQPSSAPSLGAASSSDLSPALERRLGEAIMVEGRRDPDYIKDPDLSQYLNAMGKRLASHAPGGAPDIEVFGVRDSIVNAFAMPGGYIGVHTGLIVSSGAEDELAGVLAHEIAHVTQRHIARGLTQQQQSSHIAIATIAAAILAALTPGGGQAAMGIAAFGQAAAIAQQLGFSRDAEQEADRTGFEMLRKAGYDPNGMAVMFGRLMQTASLNEGRGGGVYVSTHPLSISRMTDMQNRIRQLPIASYQATDEFWFVRAKARVLQATDPRALVQAIEQMQEEIRVNAKAGATTSGSAVRQAAAWYGLSLAAVVRKDFKTAASSLEQAQALNANSPYMDLQRIELDLARKQVAQALLAAQSAQKRWPDRRAFALKVAQCLQLQAKNKEAITYLQEQIKRWPKVEPDFYKMLGNSHDHLNEPVAARQSMASYYEQLGALSAAVAQLQQARSLSQDFYLQSQLDVQIRALTAKIAEDRRLLERFKS